MKFRDSGLNFGLVSVVGHWTGAVLLVAFLASAILSVFSEAALDSSQNATLLIALITAPVFAFRLYWRITNFHPAPLGGASPAQVLAGRGIALGMLLAGVVLPLMYLAKEIFAAGYNWWLTPLFWLGVFCFSGGLVLHLYGAYTHTFILKDNSLKRLAGRKIDL
ncbi:Cytochrome b561 [Roseovarius marisflavi]|uniref:Cytochrome b561 n=1 Tax=Roseovarius marisflavi TaxID=1054996 RepID=A0A1M7DJ77_9RHOB|nr:cytochrome b/b6 domain-containing protein [Roseovarius marisflavi]SHL79433.1 Cytochrome b561 [Roseovarius marisflavi]